MSSDFNHSWRDLWQTICTRGPSLFDNNGKPTNTGIVHCTTINYPPGYSPPSPAHFKIDGVSDAVSQEITAIAAMASLTQHLGVTKHSLTEAIKMAAKEIQGALPKDVTFSPF
jgi:hypothetical protein